MPAEIKLSVAEALKLADKMEAQGDDASVLRHEIGEITPKPSKSGSISDDEYVKVMREKSDIQEGDGLACSVCNEETGILISGTCESCFREWALTTKKD